MTFGFTGIAPFPDLMESMGRCLASRRQRYVAQTQFLRLAVVAESNGKALMPRRLHNAVQATRRRIGHLIPNRTGLGIADRNVGETPRHVLPPLEPALPRTGPVNAPTRACDVSGLAVWALPRLLWGNVLPLSG